MFKYLLHLIENNLLTLNKVHPVEALDMVATEANLMIHDLQFNSLNSQMASLTPVYFTVLLFYSLLLCF